MSKVDVKFKDGSIEFGVDLNQDGEKSVEAKLHLSEALQEVIKRGEKIEGAKVVDFDFSISGITLLLDTDKDGEKLFELKLNFSEAADEFSELFKKKP